MREKLLEIIKSECIIEGKEHVLASGKKSNKYFDIKHGYGIGNPNFLAMASEEVRKIIDPSATVVVGEGHGGMRLASAYAALNSINSCCPRSEKKKHGTGKRLEGYVPTMEDRVVILDDVFTTGGSLEETASIIYNEAGVEVIQACVIVRRDYSQISFPVESVFTLEDFV